MKFYAKNELYKYFIELSKAVYVKFTVKNYMCTKKMKIYNSS